MNKCKHEGKAEQTPVGANAALTPDGQVAQRIVEQLLANALIDPTQAKSVWTGLAGGAALSADWRFVAETAMMLGGRDAADAD